MKKIDKIPKDLYFFPSTKLSDLLGEPKSTIKNYATSQGERAGQTIHSLGLVEGRSTLLSINGIRLIVNSLKPGKLKEVEEYIEKKYFEKVDKIP